MMVLYIYFLLYAYGVLAFHLPRFLRVTSSNSHSKQCDINFSDPTDNGDGTWDVTMSILTTSSMPVSLSEVTLSINTAVYMHSQRSNAAAYSKVITVKPIHGTAGTLCLPECDVECNWCGESADCSQWVLDRSFKYKADGKKASSYCWTPNSIRTSTTTSSSSSSSALSVASNVPVKRLVKLSTIPSQGCDGINGCPNLDFTYRQKQMNIPLLNIEINDVTFSNGVYQATIHAKVSACLSLKSLNDLSIQNLPGGTIELFSRNNHIQLIDNACDWSYRVSFTQPQIENGLQCMPVFQIRYDWCNNLQDYSECSLWKFQNSWSFITGCNNYNHDGSFTSQTDAADFCWNPDTCFVNSVILPPRSSSSIVGISSKPASASSSVPVIENTLSYFSSSIVYSMSPATEATQIYTKISSSKFSKSMPELQTSLLTALPIASASSSLESVSFTETYTSSEQSTSSAKSHSLSEESVSSIESTFSGDAVSPTGSHPSNTEPSSSTKSFTSELTLPTVSVFTTESVFSSEASASSTNSTSSTESASSEASASSTDSTSSIESSSSEASASSTESASSEASASSTESASSEASVSSADSASSEHSTSSTESSSSEASASSTDSTSSIESSSSEASASSTDSTSSMESSSNEESGSAMESTSSAESASSAESSSLSDASMYSTELASSTEYAPSTGSYSREEYSSTKLSFLSDEYISSTGSYSSNEGVKSSMESTSSTESVSTAEPPSSSEESMSSAEPTYSTETSFSSGPTSSAALYSSDEEPFSSTESSVLSGQSDFSTEASFSSKEPVSTAEAAPSGESISSNEKSVSSTSSPELSLSDDSPSTAESYSSSEEFASSTGSFSTVSISSTKSHSSKEESASSKESASFSESYPSSEESASSTGSSSFTESYSSSEESVFSMGSTSSRESYLSSEGSVSPLASASSSEKSVSYTESSSSTESYSSSEESVSFTEYISGEESASPTEPASSTESTSSAKPTSSTESASSTEYAASTESSSSDQESLSESFGSSSFTTVISGFESKTDGDIMTMNTNSPGSLTTTTSEVTTSDTLDTVLPTASELKNHEKLIGLDLITNITLHDNSTGTFYAKPYHFFTITISIESEQPIGVGTVVQFGVPEVFYIKTNTFFDIYSTKGELVGTVSSNELNVFTISFNDNYGLTHAILKDSFYFNVKLRYVMQLGKRDVLFLAPNQEVVQHFVFTTVSRDFVRPLIFNDMTHDVDAGDVIVSSDDSTISLTKIISAFSNAPSDLTTTRTTSEASTESADVTVAATKMSLDDLSTLTTTGYVPGTTTMSNLGTTFIIITNCPTFFTEGILPGTTTVAENDSTYVIVTTCPGVCTKSTTGAVPGTTTMTEPKTTNVILTKCSISTTTGPVPGTTTVTEHDMTYVVVTECPGLSIKSTTGPIPGTTTVTVGDSSFVIVTRSTGTTVPTLVNNGESKDSGSSDFASTTKGESIKGAATTAGGLPKAATTTSVEVTSTMAPSDKFEPSIVLEYYWSFSSLLTNTYTGITAKPTVSQYTNGSNKLCWSALNFIPFILILLV